MAPPQYEILEWILIGESNTNILVGKSRRFLKVTMMMMMMMMMMILIVIIILIIILMISISLSLLSSLSSLIIFQNFLFGSHLSFQGFSSLFGMVFTSTSTSTSISTTATSTTTTTTTSTTTTTTTDNDNNNLCNSTPEFLLDLLRHLLDLFQPGLHQR